MATSHHDATLNNAASSYTTSVDSAGQLCHVHLGQAQVFAAGSYVHGKIAASGGVLGHAVLLTRTE